MNIPGLDYNTRRKRLVMPEYGREVQDMVNHCLTIADRAERQRCANTIVRIMERMTPHARETNEYKQKLWNHVAIMSGFALDIDYPFDVSAAGHLGERPKPLPYPMRRIPVRHYGNMVFEMFDILKNMPEGQERTELTRLVANQMKRDLVQWGHGSSDDAKVADDLAYYTGGKVTLNLDNFRFERTETRFVDRKRKRK